MIIVLKLNMRYDHYKFDIYVVRQYVYNDDNKKTRVVTQPSQSSGMVMHGINSNIVEKEINLHQKKETLPLEKCKNSHDSHHSCIRLMMVDVVLICFAF